MESQVLITPVDEMVTYIKSHPKSSIEQIAKFFKLRDDLVEKWVTVLEEQKIVRVEFQGLSSIVTFNKGVKKADSSIDNIKDMFVKACYRKKLPNEKMKVLWKAFVEKFEAEIKAEFEKESKRKKFEPAKIPIAWKRFRKTLDEL